MKTPNSVPAGFVDLQPLALLRVRGADAAAFLQGQLSSDVRRVDAAHAQISSYNSPKGRMLAVLHLVGDGDSTLLELHDAVAETTLRRLRMFVLRSDVTIEPATPALRCIGLLGENASQTLAALGLPAPSGPLQCARDADRGLVVVRRLGPAARFSVIGADSAIAALTAGAPAPLAFDAWRRADIEAGVPVVYPQTSDHFVPQMANLDLLGGISFDKGCYTGQEIVARLHYLGQIKRRLFVCRVAGAAPLPGSGIVAGPAGDAAGEVVDAVDSGQGAVVSAVLQLSHRASEDLRLEDARALHVIHAPAG